MDLRSHARKARMEKLVDKTPTNCPTELQEKSETDRHTKREKREGEKYWPVCHRVRMKN
jgi:hypothetical protein